MNWFGILGWCFAIFFMILAIWSEVVRHQLQRQNLLTFLETEIMKRNHQDDQERIRDFSKGAE